MELMFNFNETEYDISKEIDWSDPKKVNKLREVRILTNSETFHPFDGFFTLYNKDITVVKEMYSVFENKSRLSYINVSSNLSTYKLNSLICCYLISQNFPKYYYLSTSEIFDIHFGGVGIKESLRLLLNAYPCLVVDCLKTVAKNDFKSTALGILIEYFNQSTNKVLLINQQANLEDITKDLLEKDDIWEKIFYPKSLKLNNKSSMNITI